MEQQANDKLQDVELSSMKKFEHKSKGSIKEFEEEEFVDHRIDLNDLYFKYTTNPRTGLGATQVLLNRIKFGENVLKPSKKQSAILKILRAIFLGLNLLLWICALLSFSSYASQFLYSDDIAQDNLYLGVALVFVTILSGLFSYYQEFKSNRIMESFKNLIPHKTLVVRDDRVEDILVSDIVVGDIVHLKYGDLIPADVRIIESQNFEVDNSCLTGESAAQKRSPELGQGPNEPYITAKNLGFFSTCAIEGTAKCIVIRVGSETLMGKVANLASNVESRKSPIGIEMDRFIVIMTVRSLIFGITFLSVALLMKYSVIDSTFFVIGIIVANIPEGLAVSFTLILAVTAKKMAVKFCLVKNLQSVETLGSTSVICSDKTGTLTQNKMSVAHLYFNGRIAEADTSEFKTGSTFNLSDEGFEQLFKVAVLSSNAKFKPGQENIPVLKRAVEGDASESAILKCMELQYPKVEKFKKNFNKVFEIPFNSRDKFSACIYEDEDGYFAVMKGAPEKIVAKCETILIKEREHVFDKDWRHKFDMVYVTLGGHGERVLGFCDKRLDPNDFPQDYKFSEIHPDELLSNLRFVGLISLIDPPRAAVPDAVSKCRTAGIKVVMVTGDHPLTAKAIARSVGIISKGNHTIEEIAERMNKPIESIDPFTLSAAVITGAELNLLTQVELEIFLCNHEEIVFARTSPEQKFKIVEAFQNLGYIVAATGDGVNDTPALKKADIGIAMGISGTEVAKESADMVLMDDDFSSIITGIEEGRRIFDNLKKLLCYSLADNIAEMYSVWVFIILRIPLPMGTIAMLLSVLATDTFPAVSIAYETAEKDILKLQPRDPVHDNLVTKELLSYAYGQTSVFEVAAGFFAYFLTLGYNGFLPDRIIGCRLVWESNAVNDMTDSYGQEWTYQARQDLGYTAQTAFFIAIVVMQVSNVIICKTRRLSLFQKGMRNAWMNIGIIFELCLAAALIYTPVVNGWLNFKPINYECWLAPIPFALFLICYDELRKFAIRNTSSGFFHNELYA